MLVNVSLGLPVLSFQRSFQSRKQKKVARSQVGAVRRIGDHWGVGLSQEVGNDERHVAGGVVFAELGRVFDVSPHMHDVAFQSLEHLQVKGWIDSFSRWCKL